MCAGKCVACSSNNQHFHDSSTIDSYLSRCKTNIEILIFGSFSWVEDELNKFFLYCIFLGENDLEFGTSFLLEGELNKTFYSYFLAGRKHLTNKDFDRILWIDYELTNVNVLNLCKIFGSRGSRTLAHGSTLEGPSLLFSANLRLTVKI